MGGPRRGGRSNVGITDAVGSSASSPGGRRPLILFHNQFFADWHDFPDPCSTPCTFTTDSDAADDADAIVFHLPSLESDLPKRKASGQLWVAWSLESRVNCPRLDDRSFMASFDLTMTYERSSDVWYPYFDPTIVSELQRPVVPRTATSPVVYLQANSFDRFDRLAFSGEVMTRVKVDSFGRIHRNQARTIPPGRRPRVALYSRYKFTLAFENSLATDYVTEKLYDPLIAGSVPVYRGAREVAELVPAPGCYIDASDFRSGRELGAYLNHLNSRDDEYLAYQQWREHPFSALFQQHLATLREPPLCRLAALVAARAGGAPGYSAG
jgi:hypothetical protein